MYFKMKKSLISKERFLKTFVQPYYIVFKIDKKYYEMLICNVLKNHKEMLNNLNIVITLFDDEEIILELIKLDEHGNAVQIFNILTEHIILRNYIIEKTVIKEHKPLFSFFT